MEHGNLITLIASLAQGQEAPDGVDTLRLNVSKERLEDTMFGLTTLRLWGVYPPWDSGAFYGLTELRLSGIGGIPEFWLATILHSSPLLRSLGVSLEITDALP
ncbi:hypothetical protein FRC11_003571, partial [Ceratobasidium sp. 423]